MKSHVVAFMPDRQPQLRHAENLVNIRVAEVFIGIVLFLCLGRVRTRFVEPAPIPDAVPLGFVAISSPFSAIIGIVIAGRLPTVNIDLFAGVGPREVPGFNLDDVLLFRVSVAVIIPFAPGGPGIDVVIIPAIRVHVVGWDVAVPFLSRLLGLFRLWLRLWFRMLAQLQAFGPQLDQFVVESFRFLALYRQSGKLVNDSLHAIRIEPELDRIGLIKSGRLCDVVRVENTLKTL